jgi:hypothetical protein
MDNSIYVILSLININILVTEYFCNEGEQYGKIEKKSS